MERAQIAAPRAVDEKRRQKNDGQDGELIVAALETKQGAEDFKAGHARIALAE